MILSKTELERLQKTTLDILIQFDAYCSENHLKYFLVSGTLLGAVRCQKWIPWDDDIDVATPREDYEILQKRFCEKPISGLFLQSAQTDPLFAREILKLRLNGSTLTEYGTAEVAIHQGIYIDIFPIDYTDRSNLTIRAWAIRRLMSLRTIKSGYRSRRLQGLRRMMQSVCSFLPAKWIDRQITRLCTRDNSGRRKNAVLLLHNYHWKKQLHKFAVFGEGCKVVFEGHSFWALADPDSFLKTVFGKQYLVPPSKAGSPHHYLSVSFPADKTDGKETSGE